MFKKRHATIKKPRKTQFTTAHHLHIALSVTATMTAMGCKKKKKKNNPRAGGRQGQPP
jgi:hypothetical protein